MLVLQRRKGESLLIGDDIEVSVISVEGGRVRLAITAPADVQILRSELVRARAANKDAASEEVNPEEFINMLEGVLPHQTGAHVQPIIPAVQHNKPKES